MEITQCCINVLIRNEGNLTVSLTTGNKDKRQTIALKIISAATVIFVRHQLIKSSNNCFCTLNKFALFMNGSCVWFQIKEEKKTRQNEERKKRQKGRSKTDKKKN